MLFSVIFSSSLKNFQFYSFCCLGPIIRILMQCICNNFYKGEFSWGQHLKTSLQLQLQTKLDSYSKDVMELHYYKFVVSH